MRQAFFERYKVWQNAFSQCQQVKLSHPGGAFYVFPQINYKDMSGREFCNYMLDAHQIAMVPGEVFGQEYMRHVRISYGGNIATQRRAATKIIEVLNG
jgi:aspartate/methionine/tyrosine aminotransferase